jgi:hypothetical protein
MAKQGTPDDPDYRRKLADYERVVATVPGIERKGAANPYTAINGNMSSYLHPRGAMALRLPPGLREGFLAAHDTSLFEAYGIVQKEYVAVPDSLLANTAALRPYFQASVDYVSGLKPKPTKGTKKRSGS